MDKKLLLLLLLIILSFNKSFSQDYKGKIDNYLFKEKDALNIDIRDVKEYIITDQYVSKKQNLEHIYINQSYQGIPVFNGQINFTLKNDEIIYAASNIENNIANRVVKTVPTITPLRAVYSSIDYLKITSTNDIKLQKKENSQKFIYEKGGVSEDPIPVKLFLKSIDGGNTIKLVWEVVINNFAGGKWWNVYVDATNGEVLETKNIVISCFSQKHLHENDSKSIRKEEKPFSLLKSETILTAGNYNVYAFPTKHPLDGNRTLLTDPSDAIASPFGWHDTNGITGEEFTNTTGNNVLAHADTSGDNTIGVQPDGGSTLNFDFPLNTNTQPNGYRNASVTNLFYVNNIMHDVWYQYGFDEASGNFQENNYGKGGVQSDYVIADGQDASGMSNANFATPADGNSGRMQMYLWTYPYIPQRLVVNSPSSVAGEYTATKADFGYQMLSLPFDWKTGDLVVADDGTSATSQDGIGLTNVEGCNAYVNPSNYTNKIVLIKRGNCNFDVKVQNAENAGAIGAIIYQRGIVPTEVEGVDYFDYVNMTGTTGSITIPAHFISKYTAATLIAETQNGPVNVTMKEPETEKDRDGSLDNQIMAHEYTHGISTRLTGGPSNSNCLGSFEQMGEGWSDWAAFMMTLSSSSTENEELNLGDYVLWGAQLREAPYTTDMSVNSYTYGYTNQVAGEVHSIGFVWASILWDLTWKYIDLYGFDDDLYTGTGGNNKLMETIVLSMKMQPCNPNFITGRDAVLAADQVLTNGENACVIWEAFARRGVGVNATVGGNEDFSLPNPMPISCTASVRDNDMINSSIRVYPNPSEGVFNIKTSLSLDNSIITVTDILGRTIYKETKSIQSQLSIDLSKYIQGIYYLNIECKDQNLNETHKIIIK